MNRYSSKKPTTPFQATIAGLSHEGRGIAILNGKKKFLRNSLPGETVLAVNTHTHSTYDEGEAIEILTASPQRVTPLCPHTYFCGGCSLQHLETEAQILFKQAVLMEQIKHIASIEPKNILPPLRSPAFGYRHKARLSVKYVAAKRKILVGFREKNGRYLADIESCAVLHPAVGQKITALSQLIQNLEASCSIAQIEIAIDDQNVALIFRHLQPLSAKDIQALIVFGQQESMRIYLQPGGIDSVHPIDANEELLYYELPKHHIRLQFHPMSFTQVNPYVNRQMVDQAIQLLQPTLQDNILDLFCGLGNFTLPLARYCQRVVGVEGEKKSVELAIANAKLNHIQNADFYQADLSKDFSTLPFMGCRFNKILLDPPRTGALEAINIIVKLNPKMILYVSCNPATLARDAKVLAEHGYQLTDTGVMDMFPHTSHVESMALFIARLKTTKVKDYV